MPSNKPLQNVTQHTGDGILLWDGNREKHIKYSMLRELKSQVVTHEGEHLSGKKAERYMDRYSKEYLKKDLSGSYKKTEVEGQV